jgi:hypothetical protein
MVETSLLKDSEIDSELLEADKQKYPFKRYGNPEEIWMRKGFIGSNNPAW